MVHSSDGGYMMVLNLFHACEYKIWRFICSVNAGLLCKNMFPTLPIKGNYAFQNDFITWNFVQGSTPKNAGLAVMPNTIVFSTASTSSCIFNMLKQDKSLLVELLCTLTGLPIWLATNGFNTIELSPMYSSCDDMVVAELLPEPAMALGNSLWLTVNFCKFNYNRAS